MQKIKNRNEENAQAVYERVNRVIGADKMPMSEECRLIALRDFTNIAREYFDLKAPPVMEVTQAEGEYTVKLVFKADRVKIFHLLK